MREYFVQIILEKTLAMPEVVHEDVKEVGSIEELRSMPNWWREPVIIRGLFSNTVAAKKWHDFDYLREIAGDICIAAKCDGSQHNFGDALTSFVTATRPEGKQCGRVTSFSDFLDEMDAGKPIFTSANDLPVRVNKQLAADLEINATVGAFQYDDGFIPIAAEFFMGAVTEEKKIATSLHAASGANLHVVINGEKDWILLDPQYSTSINSFLHTRVQYVSAAIDIANEEDETSQAIFKRLPFTNARLNKGDAIWVPSWWFHYVRHLLHPSISVSMREPHLRNILDVAPDFEFASTFKPTEGSFRYSQSHWLTRVYFPGTTVIQKAIHTYYRNQPDTDYQHISPWNYDVTKTYGGEHFYYYSTIDENAKTWMNVSLAEECAKLK